MEVIANFGVLMRLAKAYSNAKKTKNKYLIDKTYKEWKAYEKICLTSDKLII